MPALRRREFLRLSATSAFGVSLANFAHAKPASDREACTLSIGTYSLKGMALEDAVKFVAEVGFDGIEIDAKAGASGEPSKLNPARRAEIRQRIEGSGLKLTSMMEQLSPNQDETKHKADVERIRQAVELARELCPAHPPVIQTVLGGGKWDEKKNLFRDRIADWQAAAAKGEVVLAIKPHRFGAMSRPEEAIWIIRELGDSRWLRMIYDYSHYAFRDMPVEQTVQTALPYTVGVAVKDAIQLKDRVGFALPGETGTFDYAKLLRLFYDGGYRGDFCCEVSAMVSGKPTYDPRAAAKTCYQNMSAAFEKSGISRA